MIVVIVIVAVIAAILLVAGGVYFLMRVIRQKEAADLNRYLQREDCQWERLADESGNGAMYFANHSATIRGIEMRVYEYAEPVDGSEGDDEGVCLSIIDRANRNGMILNGFTLHLEAMQFGDTIWNDQFLGDSGIMERMIQDKRVEWDQMQQEIIIGHYALFM